MSNCHITEEDIRVTVDESPEMKEITGAGAKFTARLTVQFSFLVSEREWRDNREFLTKDISQHIRRAVLSQIYGDVWAMASAASRYMIKEMNPLVTGLGYQKHPGFMWLALLREMGRIKPQEPKKEFSEYAIESPPKLASVLIGAPPQPQHEKSIIITGG
jgi:hypothetical protein